MMGALTIDQLLRKKQRPAQADRWQLLEGATHIDSICLSPNLLWKSPHRNAQMCASNMLQNPIRLTRLIFHMETVGIVSTQGQAQ